MRYLEPFDIIAEYGSFERIVLGLGSISRAGFCAGLRPPRAIFLTAGLGCAVPLALGLALGSQSKNQLPIAAVEGDGALLHAPNALLTLITWKDCDLDLMVIENRVYGSTGGQPIPIFQSGLDLASIAVCIGITSVTRIESGPDLRRFLRQERSTGLRLAVIQVDPKMPRLKAIPDDIVFTSLQTPLHKFPPGS